MSTLSIIIATLGRPSLEDAVRSATSQFTSGDEVIVVHDTHGVADSTDVRTRVAALGSQVVYAGHDAGRHFYGGTAQSNHGFSIARGEYVMSLGDDDAYVDGALDKVRVAIAPGKVLIGRVFVPHNGLILPGAHVRERDAINGCGIVSPREHLQPFPLSGLPSADFDWMEATIASTGHEPVYLDACIVITDASRRNGMLATAGPVHCQECHRGILSEDAVDGRCVICRTPKPSSPAVAMIGRRRKIVFVWPAAEMSVSDVARGYRGALARAGHDVIDFKLHNRFKYHAAALAASPGGDRSGDMGLLSREATDGIAAFVLTHEPDLVCIVSGMSFHPNGLVYLRKMGVPTVTIFTESPYDDAEQIAFAEVYPEMVCATQDEASARARGWIYLPPAFDPEIHFTVPRSDEFACDVFMVATGWQSRQDALEAVDWRGIDARLYGHWPGVTPESPIFKLVRWTPRGSMLLSNTVVAHAYASAKICLNIHRDASTKAFTGESAAVKRDGYSVNPRVIEIAACGGFMLTDHREDLHRVFSGIDVPTFDAQRRGDLEYQIRWWLSRPDARQRIAAQMHDAVRGIVHSETFDARARALFKALETARDRAAVVA